MSRKKKYIWIAAAITAVLIIGWRVASSRNKKNYTVSGTVARQNVRQSVLATGTVTSQSNLNLSFKNTGVVSKVNVSVNDKVRKGQVLAWLDQRDAAAAINQANASLLTAKANYDKLVNGASSPEIEVSKAAVQAAQVTLNNAKNTYNLTIQQQDTAVKNAQSAMLNAGLAATPSVSNSSSATVTISGVYNSTEQGAYKISLQQTGYGLALVYSGLESGSAQIIASVPIALGQRGLYITFSSTSLSSSDSWVVSVPNTQSSTYLSSYNAYQAALQTQAQTVASAKGAVDSAQAALDQANANLALKQAAARPEDIAAYQAAVSTAQAQLQVAQNQYANNQIVAPIDGTITAVNLKLGETQSAAKEAIVMLDQTELHVESNIAESSIALVKQGQKIDMTLDAFGLDRHFSGEVISIDPASTVVSGVINYRIVSSIPKDAEIKPGMTVNMVIVIAEKENVIAVPNRLIKTENGKKFVVILKDNKPADAEVATGLAGDSSTEIISGIDAGDTLVSLTAK